MLQRLRATRIAARSAPRICHASERDQKTHDHGRPTVHLGAPGDDAPLVLTPARWTLGGVEAVERELRFDARSGEVLVKVVAAPVNPSDYGKWKGKPGPPPKPVAMGLEGSGTVVASGGGVMAGSMVGKRIGFTNPQRARAHTASM